MTEVRRIQMSYDAEARMWWADSDDVPGLVTEAPTVEALIARASEAASELLGLNGTTHGAVTLRFVHTKQVEIA